MSGMNENQFFSHYTKVDLRRDGFLKPEDVTENDLSESLNDEETIEFQACPSSTAFKYAIEYSDSEEEEDTDDHSDDDSECIFVGDVEDPIEDSSIRSASSIRSFVEKRRVYVMRRRRSLCYLLTALVVVLLVSIGSAIYSSFSVMQSGKDQNPSGKGIASTLLSPADSHDPLLVQSNPEGNNKPWEIDVGEINVGGKLNQKSNSPLQSSANANSSARRDYHAYHENNIGT